MFISRTAGDVGPYDAKRTVEKNLSREIQFKQFDKSKFETVIYKLIVGVAVSFTAQI